ncbi:MAG: hypothetical protein Q9195_007673 [Heterodermia aff. obscurata]
MSRAKSLGIDAFALNIGVDSYTDEQLGYAYDSASKNGMKVFISFDFNWFSTSQASEIGAKIAQYGSKDAQLKIGDQVFVSSFSGDGLDIDAVRSSAGMPIFFAPNFQASNVASVDAALNWIAWPNNGNNKAPTASSNITVEDGDNAYTSALAGKPYIAPASPWFSTHYGPEVSYSKNWVFPADLLWYNRWTDILNLAPQYVEIITWNDYGESHYIGPLSSPHVDDGGSKWVNDMPHDGWLEMAKPFIAAYKAGSTSVGDYISDDQLIYWYRPSLKSASCDATDNTAKPANVDTGNYFQGIPNGADEVADSVFVVALLTAAATVEVTSGSNRKSFNAQAGASAFAVDMGTGQQSFSLTRGGKTVLSGTSLKDISSGCICGIYNFNAYVGTLPAGPSDPLQSPDGFKNFEDGLAQGICEPAPSLGTAPEAATGTPAVTSSPSPESQTRTSQASGPSSKASITASGPSIATPVLPIATASTGTTTTQPDGSTTITASGPSIATPVPPIATASTAATTQPDGSPTITALSQLYPTNCLQATQIWAGPVGADPPARCDGS